MEIKKELNKMKQTFVIQESLTDYVGPIFICGEIDWLLENINPVVISMTMPRENFIIQNDITPNWINQIRDKYNNENNILLICDMDKISMDRQEILLDMLEDNQISSEELPENLKIIIQSDTKCNISTKIRDIVEYYEI